MKHLKAVTTAADQDPGEPNPNEEIVGFSSPRRSVWGTGCAARIHLPAPWYSNVHLVAEALSQVDTRDEVRTPGSGAVAFGALPFNRLASAELVVPQIIHGHTAEGARWRTEIGPISDAGLDPALFEAPGVSSQPPECETPSTVDLQSVRSAKDWCAAVLAATELIKAGQLTKVVLARELLVQTDCPISATQLYLRLLRLYPAALCFAVNGFVGASPELLVSRVGEIVRAHPMAGTTPRTGEAEQDQRRASELLGSQKNRREHQITIDMVHDTLLPWCSYLDAEPVPSVVAAGPVQHLASTVEGRLSRPTPHVLDLVAALHPTPAVGGWPRGAALKAIDELELADRGPYAGPVGWTDAGGNGAFAVGIRAVELAGNTARLFAGVGVVEDSDPDAELEETRTKAQALLGAIVRV